MIRRLRTRFDYNVALETVVDICIGMHLPPKLYIFAWHLQRLSSDAKIVYSYITTENENATLEEIAEILGISKESVEKALNEIKFMKWKTTYDV